MVAALRFLAGDGVDLVVTTGGLGPTADDLTAEVVAAETGRPLELDEQMEKVVGDIISRFADRLRWDADALAAANRKQAMVPRRAAPPGGRGPPPPTRGPRARRMGPGAGPSLATPPAPPPATPSRRTPSGAARRCWSCPARRARSARCGTRRWPAARCARSSPAP